MRIAVKLNSISNRTLTLLRKLNQKKYRYQEKLFLAEGGRTVEQIIANGKVEITELLFDESQSYWQEKQWENTTQSIDASIVDAADFAEVSDTENPQGVIALCRMPPEVDLQDLAQKSGIILATDAIQDPGNMGTIIRTASWFGITGLLSGKGSVDLFHPKVVRSTAGATGSIPYANVDLNEELTFFEERDWQIILLDAGPDAVSLKEIEGAEKTMVVTGNEASGVDASLFNDGRQKVRISSPENKSGVESLNAAIASSIALYSLLS